MSDHRTQINVELKQLLRHLQNEASKQKNQTTIWKEQELRRNHRETLKISGENPNLHFVTCTWHWHWSLQAPRFIHQKRQRWNWRWANAGGPDGQCTCSKWMGLSLRWELPKRLGWPGMVERCPPPLQLHPLNLPGKLIELDMGEGNENLPKQLYNG